MYAVRIALLVVHIASAALLFGAPLGIVRSARRALGSSVDAFKLAADDASRRAAFAQIGSTLTLFSGVGLILVQGGMGQVDPSIHAALGLMFVGIVVMYLVTRPGVRGLVKSAEGANPDKAAATAAIKRIAAGTGIGHLLWLVILILMLVRFR